MQVVCDCGTTKEVWAKSVLSGATKSCGCLRSNTTRSKNTTHGLSHSRLYSIWSGMKKRCTNPNDSHYAYYGGRGIKVCKTWQSFECFHTWATSNGYHDSLTIDRIKTDKDYKPSNCQWIPPCEQAKDKCKPIRRSDGREYTSLKEAALDVGLKNSVSISKAADGTRYTAGGYTWQYI